MKPDAASHRCWRSSSANAPVSICCEVSPRAAPTSRAWPTAHSTSTSEQARPMSLRQVAGHDVHEEHPAAGPVVHAPPSLDLTVRVAHHDVLAGAQPVLGDLDQHVVDPGARPAAAVALVVAQQVGQPGDLEPVRRVGRARPPSRPAARPGAPRAPRGRSRTGTRRGSRVLIVPGRSDTLRRVRAAASTLLDHHDGLPPRSRRAPVALRWVSRACHWAVSTSTSCSSSITRTIASVRGCLGLLETGGELGAPRLGALGASGDLDQPVAGRRRPRPARPRGRPRSW